MAGISRGVISVETMLDLKVQRECSLKRMETTKDRMLGKLRSHFSILKIKIPKDQLNEKMGNLLTTGVLNDALESNFIATITSLDDANTLQSTFREFHLKPTPKFDDISAIAVCPKEKKLKKNAPAPKRKENIILKPSQVVLYPDLANLNNEKFFNELRKIRSQSIQRITKQKEDYKEMIRNHFADLRKKIPYLEKEYTICRDEGNLEILKNSEIFNYNRYFENSIS